MSTEVPDVSGRPDVRFEIIDTGVILTLEELIEANPLECEELHAWALDAQPSEEWLEGAGVRCICTEAVGM